MILMTRDKQPFEIEIGMPSLGVLRHGAHHSRAREDAVRTILTLATIVAVSSGNLAPGTRTPTAIKQL